MRGGHDESVVDRRADSDPRSRPAPCRANVDDRHALPALARAEKLSRRAASVQFDWPDWRQTLAKVREELDEVAAAAEAGNTAEIQEELGDLLFAAANLARKLGVEGESALRDANVKFDRRFRYVETRASEDAVPLAEAGLERLDGYWNEIRAKERG